ncbi:FecCD family ABC transporter permease [Thermococcus waiotapuensis]|uniref:Iron ABC transporter permease n=1 Tax=Thermococcus waiotapuensis TaxID=90909 RepID=A0AAE4NW25_9EURY|nr:iron ABC transporter permease [Thermococcus waiotapuensis]MDV3103893.1 iron ABC transporter permease [Thermococcus waiotapuensis]
MKKFALAILPLLAILLDIFIGSYPTNPFHLTEGAVRIIWDIRLPRALMGVSAGIALSLGGMILQAVFRNPLVDTYILGVSSGVALGAAVAVTFLPFAGIAPLALLFSLLAVSLAYWMARINGKVSTVSLILAGIIVTAFFSALLSLLELLLPSESLSALVVWLMGSLSGASWEMVTYSLPGVLILALILFLLRWNLNAMSLGDEAELLGLNVHLWRGIFVFISALMTALVVSFTGIIGWLGLIVPHIARMLVGPEHSKLIPATISIGITMMVLADFVVRLLPGDVPVGIITTLVGVPFFGYLLRKTGGGWS